MGARGVVVAGGIWSRGCGGRADGKGRVEGVVVVAEERWRWGIMVEVVVAGGR